MATNTTTPNMALTIPTVGAELGPAYAFDVNGDLTLIDQHDHSLGKGVQITPAGLNINAALTFQNNSATNLSGTTFTAQTSASTVFQTLSVAPGGEVVPLEDLWYTDSAGNQVQITKAGALNASVASIPGESYSAGTFTWRQPPASLIPANFDIGSITLRPNIASTTFGVTLSPPSGVASQYNIFLPTTPVSLTTPTILTLNSSGQIAASYTFDDTTIQQSGGVINVINVPAGAITGTQVSNNINLPGTSVKVQGQNVITSQTNASLALGMIRGSVSAAASLTAGEGFGVTAGGTGQYFISFTNPFADTPVVVVSINPPSGGIGTFVCQTIAVSSTGCQVLVYNNGSGVVNQPFSFIAIGQR